MKDNRRLLGLVGLLLTGWSSAAVRLDSHPLINMIAANTALRQGVIREIQILSTDHQATPAGASAAARVEKRVALGLAAYRDEIPAGAAEEILGPETARLLKSMSVDPDALAEIRENIWPEDPADMARAAARMQMIYDHAAPGTNDEALGTVVGKENRAQQHLPASTSFMPQSIVTPKKGEGLPGAVIERGTYGGREAVRLRLGNDNPLLAVKVGKASTWDEARALARQAVAGGDLPTPEEYMLLVMSTALDVKLPMGSAEDAPGIYPMWARSENEAENASALAKTSKVIAAQDGAGAGYEWIDIGASVVAEQKQALAEITQQLQAGQHRSDDEQRRIDRALKKTQGQNERLNPDIAHPDRLPAEINALIKKPSKASLLEAQAFLRRSLAAFGSGYVVYSVASGKPPPKPSKPIDRALH